MQTQGPDEGKIRELKENDQLQLGEVSITQEEVKRLRGLELHERVDALRGMRDHHNQRRRKHTREEAKASNLKLVKSPKVRKRDRG